MLAKTGDRVAGKRRLALARHFHGSFEVPIFGISKVEIDSDFEVANTWTKTPGSYRYAMGRNGKEPQTP